jgi:hypothetical protein
MFNPQSLNRFSYGLNNPSRYTDPTGHTVDCAPYDTACKTAKPLSPEYILNKFNVSIDAKFNDDQKWAIVHGVIRVAYRFAKERNRNETASQAFTSVFDEGMNFNYGATNALEGCKPVTKGGCTSSNSQINFWTMAGQSSNDIFRMTGNVIHEIGHALNYQYGENPVKNMPWSIVENRTRILQPNSRAPVPNACDDCEYYQFNREPNSPSEMYADMFVAWMYNTLNSSPENALDVSIAQTWMDNWTP